MCYIFIVFFFFFNDTATTEIYTLSLHDALPISRTAAPGISESGTELAPGHGGDQNEDAHDPLESRLAADRKSTRLNSSHLVISYAVFCLKKKIKTTHMLLSDVIDASHQTVDVCT